MEEMEEKAVLNNDIYQIAQAVFIIENKIITKSVLFMLEQIKKKY